MALEYQLKIATDQSAEGLLGRLASFKEMRRMPNPGRLDFLQGNGLSSVDVHPVRKWDFGSDPINENFGFSPTLSVGFRFLHDDPSGGLLPSKTMMAMVQQLLAEISGDAILLFNGESVMLVRRASKIVVNQKWGWSEGMLENFALHYDIAPLKEVL